MEKDLIHALIAPYKERIEQLQQQLKDLKPVEEIHRSEKIDQLSLALAKAQGEMKVAKINAENPYFKTPYADLNSVVQASRPALSKYHLSVAQPIVRDAQGSNILHTILMHESGQYIESRTHINPHKGDMQTLKSYITSLKRLAYESLVGVVTQSDDDDGMISDADAIEGISKGVALNHKYNPKEQSYETITKEQIEEAEYELSEYPDIAEQVMEGLRIQSLADMPKSKFLVSMRRIREIKNLRNSGK